VGYILKLRQLLLSHHLRPVNFTAASESWNIRRRVVAWIREYLFGNDVEESGNVTIELCSLHVRGGTEEGTVDVSLYSGCRDRNSKREPPEHRSHALTLLGALRCNLRSVPVYTQTGAIII
jgi:hypothetical protein